MLKVAGSRDLPIVENIMRRIHDEEPSYWPYGLDKMQFNGGLYLIQKSASTEPVGFVGWQQFPENGRNIGYYAIGILPQHREQGFAKEAVTQVIREINQHCDEVKAFIAPHNGPSKALARSLDVPVIEKAASAKKQLLSALGTGVGSTLLFDQAADPHRTLGSSLQPWNWDKDRSLMGALNVILGGVGGQRMAKGHFGEGLTAIGTIPVKDLALKGIGSLSRFDEATQEAAKNYAHEREKPAPPEPKSWFESVPREAWMGAGGLGLGLLGLLAYNAKKKRDIQARALDEAHKGRVKITLPTKNPGDSETQVDLPFAELNLSDALRGRLGRDTKRRLYEETKARTRHRRPRNPAQPTPLESEDMELAEEEATLAKESALQELVEELYPLRKIAVGPAPAPATGVPTPPQLGQNPAVRMQQTNQAVANSIQTSTAANPQIMKAQQAAMAAEQAGQQQTAQVQQQADQAQMEQQQQFQQAMSKAEQEKETLKLELAKQKALTELKDATAKAQQEASKMQSDATADASAGEGTQAQRLISNRIARLQKRVLKSAAENVSALFKAGATPPPRPAGLDPRVETYTPLTPKPGAAPQPRPYDVSTPTAPGSLDPKTGLPIPRPAVHYRPEAVDNYNRNPAAIAAAGQPLVARHSYGKLLDPLFDMFMRDHLYKPKPKAPTLMSQSEIINNPDQMGMLSQYYNNQIIPTDRSDATNGLMNRLAAMAGGTQ